MFLFFLGLRLVTPSLGAKCAEYRTWHEASRNNDNDNDFNLFPLRTYDIRSVYETENLGLWKWGNLSAKKRRNPFHHVPSTYIQLVVNSILIHECRNVLFNRTEEKYVARHRSRISKGEIRKGDDGSAKKVRFRRALLGIATRVSAEPEANIRGVVAARYNRGAPLRKPVTCSALPRAPPVRILHVYVYIHPRDGIIVTCSGEPRTRSSSTSNDRLSSGGDDTFLFSLPFHFHLFSIPFREEGEHDPCSVRSSGRKNLVGRTTFSRWKITHAAHRPD